jgi:hypothetical protein
MSILSVDGNATQAIADRRSQRGVPCMRGAPTKAR